VSEGSAVCRSTRQLRNFYFIEHPGENPMLDLFGVLHRLAAILQKTVTFWAKQPGCVSKTASSRPPCGGMWCPSRSLPILPLPFFLLLPSSLPFFIPHPSPVPCGYPSSLLFMWGFVGGIPELMPYQKSQSDKNRPYQHIFTLLGVPSLSFSGPFLVPFDAAHSLMARRSYREEPVQK
jgi:hypothetical protein